MEFNKKGGVMEDAIKAITIWLDVEKTLRFFYIDEEWLVKQNPNPHWTQLKREGIIEAYESVLELLKVLKEKQK